MSSGNKNHDYNDKEIDFKKNMRNCDRPNVIPFVVRL